MNDLERFPDPRSMTHTDEAGETRLRGWRCEECSMALALESPWCPRCLGTLREVQFGPFGTVWSSTVVRIPLPGRTPPYGLLYVDLDDGPRVLGHLATLVPTQVAIGEKVRLVANTELGDLAFEIV